MEHRRRKVLKIWRWGGGGGEGQGSEYWGGGGAMECQTFRWL